MKSNINRYSSLVLVYTTFFSIFMSLGTFALISSFETFQSNFLAFVFLIISSISFYIASILFSILFWKNAYKKYKEVIEIIPVILIGLYITISLIISIFIAKFSPADLQIDSANNMIQISWIVFGVSNALYLAGVGFAVSNQNDSKKKALANYSIYIYPMLLVVLVLVVATIMFYCFFNIAHYYTSMFVNISFITSLLSAPYYLLLCVYLSKKPVMSGKE